MALSLPYGLSAKGTTIKEAVASWERKHGAKIAKAKVVKLVAQFPPIEKMDHHLNGLDNCEQLSLSTNAISKITNLGSFKHLRILSLGRNNISNLTGLEPVSHTLEELWISYNQIEKLRGINVLRRLRVLYMSNNQVKDWMEFQKLADLTHLEELVFIGNPLEDRMSQEGVYRDTVCKRLPGLRKLDGVPIVPPEVKEEILKSEIGFQLALTNQTGSGLPPPGGDTVRPVGGRPAPPPEGSEKN